MTLETGYGATSYKKDVGKYKCIDSRRIFTRIQEKTTILKRHRQDVDPQIVKQFCYILKDTSSFKFSDF